MVKYIKCGKYNTYYKYISSATLFCVLSTILLGYGYCNDTHLLKFPRTEGQKLLSQHIIIHNIYLNAGIIIFSLILYKYEKLIFKNDKKKEKPKHAIIELIHEDTEKNLEEQSFLNIIIVIILYNIQDILTVLFFQNDFKCLNLWILELPLLSFFNFKLLNTKLHSHHKFAICLSVIPCLITKLIIIFIFSFSDEDLVYHIYKYKYLIPVGIIYYLIIITIRSYTVTEMKIFMDLRYISPSKLLIFYGVIGFLINFIICIISTYNKCLTIGDIDIHLCKINNDTNPNEKYLENFFIYFQILKGSINKDKTYEVIIEVLVSFFGTLIYFCFIYFYILIIHYLSSVHVIFYSFIYAFSIRVCNVIFGNIFGIIESPFKNKKMIFEYIIESIFTVLSDITSGLGIFIYLEVIELDFCNFSYNLRRNIMRRSEDDLNGNDELLKIYDEENDEEKENSNTFLQSNCAELTSNNNLNNKE